MNNNVNMAVMNAMGGQVGGGMSMMNNGMPGGQRQQQQQHTQQAQQAQHQQQQISTSPETAKEKLNSYIYEYFIHNQMYDCARSLRDSKVPINLLNSPGRRRGANGMEVGGSDGIEDTKDSFNDIPADLPEPGVPKDSEESFLYEWWCLFWDMYNAQRGNSKNAAIKSYQEFTQAKSRQQQHEQATMLRNISQMGGSQGMAMRGPNGLPMAQQNDLARKAMQNNGGRNLSDAQIRMMQQRQQQMQRGGSDMDARMQGAGSPGSGENAPSPSKRPRLDGAQFNGPMGMQNDRGPGGMSGQNMAGGPGGPQNPMMLANGMNSSNLAAQQFQNYPGQGGPGAANKAQIQQYTNQLAQHQQAQKAMVNPNGPQGQGSPMIQTGPDGQPFYSDAMVNGGRPGQPAAGANGQTGSHALQDYQMQLMLLEQQNKKRLLMARQEQDSMSGVREGPPNPNGQPFSSTSPNGARSVNSPNPNEMMKRGTPQMAAGQMPSPEGQSRGSPASMNFMAQNMDPNQAAQFYNKNQMNGMDMGMAGPNGMRQPPSSHPAGFNNGQMNQQQMMNMQRQQQQQAQQQANVGQVPGWNGANAAPMMQQQGSQQGSQSGSMGTPQQRAMPPPSVPAAAQAQNGRTQPSSPQQTPAPPTPSQAKKANPKAKKETKPKRKAGQAAAGTTGATPAGDAPEQPPTPTPQTPITPAHPMNFGKNGQPNNGQGGANNSQSTVPAVSQPPISQPQAPDASNHFQMDEFSMPMDGMDFAHPMAGGDVLQDFDFDSFLHNDSNEAEQFNFPNDFGLEGEVGAE